MALTKDFIILGDPGFPYKKNAPSNKHYIVSKLLKKNGYHVRVFNKYNTIKDMDHSSGVSSGLEFEFLSGKKMLHGVRSKVLGLIYANLRLAKRMKSISANKRPRYLLFSYSSYPMLLWVRLLSTLYGYKLILNVWEYHQAVVTGLRKKIDVHLFYRHAYRMVDGAISISTFLQEQIDSSNPLLPVVLIPALTDFDENEGIKSSIHKRAVQKEYFLYCGGVDYKEAIEVIVSAFQKINHRYVELILVLNGKSHKIERIRQKMSTHGQIKIWNNLPYHELLGAYGGAKALLIPLKSSLSDIARFPQKVPEYLSSGRPVITTASGDIGKLLKHRETALFAGGFDADSLASEMRYVMEHPEIADEIGRKGMAIGREQFHYLNVEERLVNFISGI